MLLDRMRHLHAENSDAAVVTKDPVYAVSHSTSFDAGDGDDVGAAPAVNSGLCNASSVIKKEIRQRTTSDGIDDGDDSNDTGGDCAEQCNGMLISASDLRQLDNGELQDLGRLVWIAEYISSKHVDKTNMRDMVRPLVATIRKSAESIGMVEDDVQELLLSAKASLDCLADAHTSVCKEYGAPAQVPARPLADAQAYPPLSALPTFSSARPKNTDNPLRPAAKTCLATGGCPASSVPELTDIEMDD